MSKKALITGINGQDGAYLAQHLLDKGYEVYGADRRRVDSAIWRLKRLGIDDDVKHVYLDLLEFSNIFSVIRDLEPDEVYNLGAQSFVGASFDQPILTAEIDAIGAHRILEAIKTINPSIKFYQASTSEMFGKVTSSPQNEDTKFHPRSPYGVSKLYAHWITRNYRESFGIFGCSGILFNHESPLRGMEFVTKKIAHAVSEIEKGNKQHLSLGNLDAKRDWGFAQEYVKGMHAMLQHSTADDYVLATGESKTIREFVDLCFKVVDKEILWEGSGLDEKGIDKASGKVLVNVSQEFFRPAEVDELRGDFTKAKKVLGWEPKVGLDELVEIMMNYELKGEI
ncbi:GDP-mannose 4,6-dehydratase [Roseivirga pacifica]|uniref:GDP-mannose 4,6-dehydratase n=1 Tax=Roseivirga pacifica TaxID=1267423 RepID=UPI002094045F|nr:GDP-mannose 4,6-dehydratase [Roseivirga pacifica]MCO6359501.1 GDP-mannose 4,6-dehydratase [Roseivirga pacifica]MCO6366871.1 GDP-mannose 4,6-dehydratase [Roseivirga pacifica]MCO6370597.1 GDP-mannose 4,6-dehydratase [Roseivirga pacifica]MCO6374528.1 GDP-mannose 4,6-dehydratase [Roseivirga pacifica]MCO6379786.1 GDP-mannose 4,6-dehydratase [Roseivirga pacifica]